MSLGFLTESALVPSKAKEIKVDAKSLVDLKAVVFQKDQDRQRRLREALTAENDEPSGSGALRLGKYAHLRVKSRQKAERGQKRRHNKGVDERNRRDEEAQQERPDEDDNAAWSKRSAEMLKKKAKLYEEMANGGGGELKGGCLVDFEAKQGTVVVTMGGERPMVDITDEFGRSRKVATDSEEYAEFLKTQSRETRFQKLGKQVDESREEDTSGEGSFVVSQWEKRLKSEEKNHLKEVHERATLAQSLAHSGGSASMDRKTRKQLRLERLRKQREQAAAAEEHATPKWAENDSAASEKATDFLNQLSTLM